jgi:hypothetical protein
MARRKANKYDRKTLAKMLRDVRSLARTDRCNSAEQMYKSAFYYEARHPTGFSMKNWERVRREVVNCKRRMEG